VPLYQVRGSHAIPHKPFDDPTTQSITSEGPPVGTEQAPGGPPQSPRNFSEQSPLATLAGRAVFSRRYTRAVANPSIALPTTSSHPTLPLLNTFRLGLCASDTNIKLRLRLCLAWENLCL
jgi:hypothetical protein